LAFAWNGWLVKRHVEYGWHHCPFVLTAFCVLPADRRTRADRVPVAVLLKRDLLVLGIRKEVSVSRWTEGDDSVSTGVDEKMITPARNDQQLIRFQRVLSRIRVQSCRLQRGAARLRRRRGGRGPQGAPAEQQVSRQLHGRIVRSRVHQNDDTGPRTRIEHDSRA